jgi:hypothetical protein
MCTSHYKAIEMRLYNQRQWKPKWKDLRTFITKTQAQVDVSRLGIREGIGLKWSCRFKLDGLHAC